MFDIGFAELLIVAVVALVVLGPEKLPMAVKTVGLWVGRIRRTVSSIQSEISEELRVEELKRTTAIHKDELEKELNEMRQPFKDALNEESPLSSNVLTPEELKEQAGVTQPEETASSAKTTDSTNSTNK
ncbi:Sec-independent protein translocase protein TatB [uncultured Neptuniibacter sp.]|uniref:Sec-independent protein translocase protein TatB n=1 Tax=uncultured Neptuniibacter sp. TaxID=502143 RepID=UPI002636EE4E|nr:Sec-independent protein translocase protein TatB [uncultured Neptuniibacter sp.]